MKNLGEIHIRTAEPEDAIGILQCLAKAFEPYRAQYTSGAFADTVLDQAALGRRMERMHVLVAVAMKETAGTVAGSSENGEGHLRGMGVLPEWQGSGLAVTLLAAIESWLKSQNCRKVTLDTTLPLGGAIKFYEKNGYRKSGQVSDFFGMPLVEYVKELT